jgi:DNA-binding protein YbaB
MPTTVHFKVVANYYKLADVDVVKSGATVVTNMTGNSKFTNVPVDLAVLKTNLDLLSALIAEAADGSKKVIARKKQQREVVIGMLRLLARYVEVVSLTDPAAIQASGFQLASTTKAQAAPLSEKIRRTSSTATSSTRRISGIRSSIVDRFPRKPATMRQEM